MDYKRLFSIFAMALLCLFATDTLAYFGLSQSGVGGGGWLQSGCFHPTNPDVMFVGGDFNGDVYRSDDFGSAWQPWTWGLQNFNRDDSNYIEDLEPVTLPNGGIRIYAATYGGIYSALDSPGKKWVLSSSVDPYATDLVPISYCAQFYQGVNSKKAVPFSCLDWDKSQYLYAGAGRVRFSDSSYETRFYPGSIQSGCISPTVGAGGSPTVWRLDTTGYYTQWEPLPLTDTFGAIRDISCIVINGVTYVAVVSKNGVFLYNGSTQTWAGLHDVDIKSPEPRANGNAEFFEMEYGDTLKGWSIHLTSRGDLYLALVKEDAGPAASGVYCLNDAISDTTQTWEYVVNTSQTFPQHNNRNLWQIGNDYFSGTEKYAAFAYMTVHDGSGNAPDTIYLGERVNYLGFWVGQHEPGNSQNTTWDNTFWSYYPTLEGDIDDLGWLDGYGCHVQFHPMVFPANDPSQDRVVVQFGGRIFSSEDGGQTWQNSYCQGSSGQWATRGYNQLVPWRIAFQDDGRVITSNADVGLLRSTDYTQESFEVLSPEIGNSNDTGFWSNAQTANKETLGVAVRPRPSGEQHDEIFATYGEAYARNSGSKLLIFDDDPGAFAPWRNAMIDSSGNFQMDQIFSAPDSVKFFDIAFADSSLCFVTFTDYAAETSGVLRGDNAGDFWYWTDISDTNWAGSQGVNNFNSILVNHYNGDRVFVAAGRTDFEPAGGVWVLEDLTTNDWSRVYYGYLQGRTLKNFHSLAQSSSGDRVYASSGGEQGGSSGIIKCTDPSNSSDLSNWFLLTEVPGFDDFMYDNHTPYWADDRTYFPHTQYTVRSLAVDPLWGDRVFVGITAAGYSLSEGIWSFSGVEDQGRWSFESNWAKYVGAGIYSLAINPYVGHQLLAGTGGLGLWVSSTFSTTKSNTRQVKAEPKTKTVFSVKKSGPTAISFSLNQSTPIDFSVFDIRGRLVMKYATHHLGSGEHKLIWDGKNRSGQRAAAGVYFGVIKAGSAQVSSKFTLIR